VGVQQSVDTPTIERFGESLSGLPQPFVVEVFGDHLPTLRRLSVEAVKRLRKIPALTDIFNNDAYPVTQLRIAPRPAAMRAFGIAPADLNRQLRPALRGEVAAQMPDGDRHRNLYIRLAGAEQLATEELGRILIRTRHGWTPLHLLADLNIETLPNQIRHLDGARVLDILAAPNGPVGDAIQEAKRGLVALTLRPGYRSAYAGLFVELDQVALMLVVAAVAALLLMSGILIVHFGGWRMPLILLLPSPPGVHPRGLGARPGRHRAECHCARRLSHPDRDQPQPRHRPPASDPAGRARRIGTGARRARGRRHPLSTHLPDHPDGNTGHAAHRPRLGDRGRPGARSRRHRPRRDRLELGLVYQPPPSALSALAPELSFR
jgi:hypothetical protein